MVSNFHLSESTTDNHSIGDRECLLGGTLSRGLELLQYVFQIKDTQSWSQQFRSILNDQRSTFKMKAWVIQHMMCGSKGYKN